MSVELKNLTKDFGSFRAVNDLNLFIETGKFVAILGPSGCGKTTTLRLLAGFEPPSKGSIFIHGRDVKHLPPRKRNLGIVFQNYALFPHLTIFQNVAYGLKMQRQSREEIKRRVHEALALVHLSGLEERKPNELSGGQQQRVALARSIVLAPDLLLFDEPLSNLDAKLRDIMRTEIRRIHQSLGITTIFVTHDQDEALSMADTVVVMNKGSIEQVGSPTEIYWRPATRFVAEFIGASNWLDATAYEVTDRQFRTKAGPYDIQVQKSSNHATGTTLQGEILIRPEDIDITAHSSGDAQTGNQVTGKITEKVFLGATVEFRVALDGLDDQYFAVRSNAREGLDFSIGEPVRLNWAPGNCSFFQDGAML